MYAFQVRTDDEVRSSHFASAEDDCERPLTKDETLLAEGVHLAVVACGERLQEPLNMIKSALAFGRMKITVNVFADSKLQEDFRK